MLDLVYTGFASAAATFAALVSLIVLDVNRSRMLTGAAVLFGTLFVFNLVAMIVETTKNKSCHLASAGVTAFVGLVVFLVMPFLLKRIPYLNKFTHNAALVIAVSVATVSWRFVSAYLLRNGC